MSKRKLFFMTIGFCLFSLLFAMCFSLWITVAFYNTFGDLVIPVCIVSSWFVYVIVHDYICRYYVCGVRKKYNVCDGCYFWNCPHYSVCPHNSNK